MAAGSCKGSDRPHSRPALPTSPVVSVRELLALAGFPLLILSWFFLVQGAGGGRVVAFGPVRAAGALILAIPAIAHWTWTPRSGRAVPSAGLFALGGFLLARQEAWTGIDSGAARVWILGASLALLVPAAAEWVGRLRAWLGVKWVLRLGFDLLIVIGLPGLYLSLASIQYYPPASWVDPGIYRGLILDFPTIIRDYGWNYQALRVPFILPNIIAGSIFPPRDAYILVAGFFYFVGLGAFYAGVRRIWDRASGAVATSLLACNPLYLLANGAGYVDGALVAYLFLLFATLTAWLRNGRGVWLVAAGACSAAAVLTHFLAAAPAGLIILGFAILGWERIRFESFPIIALGVLGGLLIWLFFVLAFEQYKFGFESFVVVHYIVKASLQGIGGNYRLPLGDWLPAMMRLVPPWLTMLTLAALVIPDGRQASRTGVFALMLAAGSVAMLPVYDVAFTGSLTQSPFYAGLVLAPAAIAVGGAVSFLLPSDNGRRVTAALGAAVLTLLISAAAPRFWSLADSLPRVDAGVLAGVSLVLAGSGALARRAGTAVRVIVVVGFVTLAAAAADLNRDTRGAYIINKPNFSSDFFDTGLFVNDLLRSIETQNRRPLFWYDRGGFASRDGNSQRYQRNIRFAGQTLALTPYDGLAALRLWDRALYSAELHEKQVIDPELLLRHPNTTLVVLDTGFDSGFETSRKLLGRAGIACHLRYAAVHDTPSFTLRVSLLDVNGTLPQPAERCDESSSSSQN